MLGIMNVTPSEVQKLLDSEDFGARIKGINFLRHLEIKTAFEMIKPIVVDKNTRVRYAAVSQLDTLGTCDLHTSLEMLRDRLFNDPEIDVRAAAADAIGGLKLTEAFEDIQQVYRETPEWLLKFSIVATLGELGDPRGLEILQDALASDSELLQITAIGALGELGEPRAIPWLLPFVDRSDWQVRYRLAQALSKLGGEQVRSALEKLAADEVEQVALEAKKYLGT